MVEPERNGDKGVSDQVWRVEVIVMPKDGVSDPQGEAVKGGLGSLGITGVQRVRVGRHLAIDVTAPMESAARATVNSMAEQLLANLVIEQYQISVVQRLDLAGVN